MKLSLFHSILDIILDPIPTHAQLCHLYVLRLTLGTTHGLMNHHARVGQSHALAFLPAGEKEAGHGGCKSEVDGDYGRFHVTHRIEKRQARNNRSAWAVDVKVDGLRGILIVEEKHHADDLVRDFVIYFL